MAGASASLEGANRAPPSASTPTGERDPLNVLRIVLGKVGEAVEGLEAGDRLAALAALQKLELRLGEARQLIRRQIRRSAGPGARVVLLHGTRPDSL